MNFLILNSKINIILVGCSTKKQIIELINHINTGIDIKLDLKRITKFSDEISKKFRAKSERFLIFNNFFLIFKSLPGYQRHRVFFSHINISAIFDCKTYIFFIFFFL